MPCDVVVPSRDRVEPFATLLTVHDVFARLGCRRVLRAGVVPRVGVAREDIHELNAAHTAVNTSTRTVPSVHLRSAQALPWMAAASATMLPSASRSMSEVLRRRTQLLPQLAFPSLFE